MSNACILYVCEVYVLSYVITMQYLSIKESIYNVYQGHRLFQHFVRMKQFDLQKCKGHKTGNYDLNKFWINIISEET